MVRIKTIFPIADPILKIFFMMVPVSSISLAAASEAQVTIESVNNPVAGTQFNLIFDSTMVGVTNVVKGNFFSKIMTFFNPGTPGYSSLSNVWEVVTTPGISATSIGTLVKVNMFTKNAGTVKTGLTKVILSDPNGKSIPFILKNGTVTISSIRSVVLKIRDMNPGYESGISRRFFYV